jgi:SNF2 family DNA or RNA helicase
MSTEVLHSTWLPTTRRFFLWGESADQISRKGRQPKIAAHPFGSSPAQLREYLERHSLPATNLEEQALTIWLPSAEKGPILSPELLSGGGVNAITRPKGGVSQVELRAWQVTGLACSPGPAVDLLLALGSVGSLGSVWSARGLGADLRAWHLAALLAMEVVAAQEMMPALARDGYQLRALWRLRLTPERAQKMAALAHALPPLARAVTDDPARAPSPRALLDDFVSTVADATMRELRFKPLLSHLSPATAGGKWLGALLGDDPIVPLKGSEADELFTAWQRWSRQGFLAGDEVFRVTFRLEPPKPEGDGDTPRGDSSQAHQPWSLSYLLQATDDPSLLVPASSVWREKGRAATFLKRHFEQPQERLLAALGYAARLFPPIEASLKEAAPARARFGPGEAFSFLKEAVPLLEQSGFGVLVPSWWTGKGARLQARARARMSSKGANEKSRLSLDTLVSFDWEITLGDEPIDHAEFERLVALKMPLVQVRGQWVVLDPEHLQKALAFFDRHGWREQQMPLFAAMPLLLDPQAQAARQGVPQGMELSGVVAEGWLHDLLAQLSDTQQLHSLPEPEGLRGKLRPYQQRGYSWLAFLRRTGFGACLADDMGLGKSIQAITLLLHEREHLAATAPALLVCPTSVVGNWVRELERFAPSLRVSVHHGADRKQGKEFKKQIEGPEGQDVDVVLTSYPLLARDRETLADVPWGTVVLDEAQNIKNASTKQAQAARALKPANRVALTGTPVENRLSELWSIMNFLNPGYLGSEAGFRREYARPIERTGDQESRERLRKLTTPFILRRLKTDKSIISDLPEKMEMKVYCSLTREQATLYQAVVQDYLEKIEASEGVERRGQVLAMLIRLKQICNHPAQYLQDGSALQGRSGKLARLVEMLEEAYASDDRALIFTQFASFGAMLQTYLSSTFYDDVLFLHGGTPAKERDPMVQRFQADWQGAPRAANCGPRIFILSLKAGGTGLNLTSANHVFHYDRWWNPAVENQATDRAFRIGQTRNVQVHKFICGGTLEDHIDEMIESKRELAESVIGDDESWLTELSGAQLRDLVTLRQADVEESE